MPTRTESYIKEVDHWTVRLRPPINNWNGRVLLLLHGWTGDENSMWVFIRSYADNYWICSPRAPFHTQEKGYAWTLPRKDAFSSIGDFETVSNEIMDRLPSWGLQEKKFDGRVDQIGFSQGAALAYALGIFFPKLIDRTVAVAGFFPRASEIAIRPGSLNNKKFFISHGAMDETVPVSEAYKAKRILARFNADVRLCESDTGHKLGLDCFKQVEQFLSA